MQQTGFEVGDTVQIIGEDFTDEVGELVTIDPEAQEGDYFGVYLDAVDSTIFFTAGEIRAC